MTMTDTTTMTTDAISEAEIETAVRAIVASGVLGKSDRREELLRYLVAQETGGHGEEIKAFTIAVDVLGRDASFDPNTDSIVRSEVGRLREALRLFYAEKAAPELVRIEIPKGSYRPVFTAGAAAAEAPRRPGFNPAILLGFAAMLVFAVLLYLSGTVRTGPDADGERAERGGASDVPYEVARIAVTPFTAQGSNPNAERLAFGLYSELSMDLSAYPWIAVVTPVGGIEDVASLNADYALQGEIFWDGDILRGTMRLLSLPDQAVIWSEVDTIAAEVKLIEDEIVDAGSKIAAEIGALRGIAPDLVKAQNARLSDEGLEAFLCFLEVYQYLEFPSDDKHLHLRDCLSEAVAEHPTFGDGWAALAIIYMDEARFERNPRPLADPWQDADHAVRQALKYEPLRMPVLNAALIESIESPDRDIEDFESHAQRLTNLFPRHTGTMVNVGSRRAEFVGQWDRGEDLIDRAIDLHPEPPSSYFVTNAYRAALDDDDAGAARSVEKLTVTTSRSQLLLRYLAAARTGAIDEMGRIRGLMAAQGLATIEDIIAHVRNRRYVTSLERALLEQLEEARQVDPAE